MMGAIGAEGGNANDDSKSISELSAGGHALKKQPTE
jgi:hypothetical protein